MTQFLLPTNVRSECQSFLSFLPGKLTHTHSLLTLQHFSSCLSSSALKNAVCYDITDLRPPELFGHDWPVSYYSQLKGNLGILEPSDRQFKSPGTIIKVQKR